VFHQSGWTDDALAGTDVEHRVVGWLGGLDPAWRHDLPLHFPRYHPGIRFARPFGSPLAIGAGRYRGPGLLVRGSRPLLVVDSKATGGHARKALIPEPDVEL
jgi:hypothetical protein